MSNEVSDPNAARGRLATLGIGAAWFLGVAAVLELVAYLLGSSSLGEAVVGALIVDLAAGRMGVAWTLGTPERAALVRACTKAGVTGALVCVLALLAGTIAGMTKTYPGRIDVYALMSVIGIVAVAIRDELLFRAVVFHTASKVKLHLGATVVFCALLSGAAAFARGASPGGLVLATSTGLLFASVYRWLGGAWPAIVAHASWSLVAGPVSRGVILDVQWAKGELTDGASADGVPAFIAAGIAAIVAIVVLPRLAPRRDDGRKDTPEVESRDRDTERNDAAREEPEALEKADPR